MDIELRWYKHARSLSYILQVRYQDEFRHMWEPWQTIPHIREGYEEDDEVRDSEELDDGC
jgi:hypothetical protein